MEDFRSKSCKDGWTIQMEAYDGGRAAVAPTNMQDLRCYSTSYAGYAQHRSPPSLPRGQMRKEVKNKKGKSRSDQAKSWSFSDPELQRKKRVASYKVYSMEGKMKGSLRKSFTWIKNTCSNAVHGWW